MRLRNFYTTKLGFIDCSYNSWKVINRLQCIDYFM